MIKFYALFDKEGNIKETFSSVNSYLKTKEELKQSKEITIEQLNEFNQRQEIIEKKIPTLLEQLEQLEKETGYNRLTRDLYFNLKKLGGTTNPNVYKKMLEIDALAKKYRKQLKSNKTEEGDLEI
ncbi:MAG: hypothetical protein NC222_06120 [Staphylococcus sp.]|nr:hypothetical protein [Staphylococcus sp.]